MRSIVSIASCQRSRRPTCRCPRTYALCEDDAVIGTAFYLMEYVEGRILWDPTLPGMTPAAARGALRRDEPRDRRAAPRRLRGGRPRRLRQARQIHRAPGRALEQAVPGRQSRDDRGDGQADRLAAAAHSRRRRDAHRPRRLPHRQRDLPSARAAHPRGARLGAVDARSSAGRLRLPLHGLAHPAGRVPRPQGPRPRGAGHPDRGGVRRRVLPAHRPRAASRTGSTTSPSTCSGSRRSCRACMARALQGNAASQKPSSRAAARGWSPRSRGTWRSEPVESGDDDGLQPFATRSRISQARADALHGRARLPRRAALRRRGRGEPPPGNAVGATRSWRS